MTVNSDSDFEKECKMLALVMMKADKHQTKMSKEAPLTGPYIVFCINIKTKVKLAKIYKRNYRNIIRYLLNATILSTSMFPSWQSTQTPNVIPREVQKASQAIAEKGEQYKKH